MLLAVIAGITGGVAARDAGRDPALLVATLNGQPYRVAVDRQMGHAFVLDITTGNNTSRGHITTIDLASGSLVRTIAAGRDPTDIIVAERTGHAFVTDIVDRTVSMLDARTGVLRRTIAVGPLPPNDVQRVALDARTGRVFVASEPGMMLDARTGRVLGTIAGGSLIGNERTQHVFALWGQTVTILDSRTGATVRTVGIGADIRHGAVASRTGRLFVTGDMGTSVLDARTGRVLGTRPVGRAVFAMLTVADLTGRVFVYDPGNALVDVLDARSGTLIRTITVDQSASAPIVSERTRRAFVVNPESRNVSVLDASTGAVLQTIPVDQHPGSLAIDERRGRIFVTSAGTTDQSGHPIGRGRLDVLDARTGAVLRTLPIGINPGLMVVDERTGHVLVVDNGGSVRVPSAWSWIPSWIRSRLPFLPSARPSLRTVPGDIQVLAP